MPAFRPSVAAPPSGAPRDKADAGRHRTSPMRSALLARPLLRILRRDGAGSRDLAADPGLWAGAGLQLGLQPTLDLPLDAGRGPGLETGGGPGLEPDRAVDLAERGRIDRGV